MSRKQDSQELATISGVDRELTTDVNIWQKGIERRGDTKVVIRAYRG